MAKAPAPPPHGGSIDLVPLHEALEERYLAYALSTITGRALPDARVAGMYMRPVPNRESTTVCGINTAGVSRVRSLALRVLWGISY